jgi:hypothetical protein
MLNEKLNVNSMFSLISINSKMNRKTFRALFTHIGRRFGSRVNL